MASKYSDLSGEELFAKNGNNSANDSGDFLIPGLCAIALIGVVWYLYDQHLNTRFNELESSQQEHRNVLDLTNKRMMNTEKKIMVTNLRIDALKTVIDYNTDEFLVWYPSIKS